MSKHANPVLIGAFVLGAIALGIITVLLLVGGQWFQEPRQHIMYFDEAGQGLQEGAPVVFLGVKVGTVKRIHLAQAPETNKFMVAVTIEVQPSMVESSAKEHIDLRTPDTVRTLVEQGLRARLRIQSLLTGQLYIDLDFYPGKPARFIGHDPDLSEIPTIPTTVEELASKLERFPVDKLFADVVAISESIKKILATPEVQTLPHRLETTLAHLTSLSQKLGSVAPPLLDEVRADLAEMRKALTSAQTAAVKIGAAADNLGAAATKTGAAATNISAFANSGTPVLTDLAGASQEIAETARTVRTLTDNDSPAIYDIRTALKEMTRAAQALRALAETLEQQPEALLRGKRTEDTP